MVLQYIHPPSRSLILILVTTYCFRNNYGNTDTDTGTSTDLDTDNNNDSDTVPSSCDPNEALQFFCFTTDSIITTAASPTTSLIATGANGPTVYVHIPIF
eukprot:CAMPEP_0170775798 /NCGR_PEP_ID=MMETSP0733-20121128/10792_1 /TAXON_ID=186038 /ORGANISM="Fragilariopsis kerguelensis, Strain L26-C5" /LENGTH=99 /DNA_ID=CAMNT_0011118663 /DNA_START=234 /DNA_END=533 /DNA_ORIENTATION=+